MGFPTRYFLGDISDGGKSYRHISTFFFEGRSRTSVVTDMDMDMDTDMVCFVQMSKRYRR